MNLIILATHRTVSIRSEGRAQTLYGPASWSSSFSCQTCRACSFLVFISIIRSWVPHRSKPDTLLKPFATTVLHSFHPHHKAFDSLLISSSWYYKQTGPQFTHDDFFYGDDEISATEWLKYCLHHVIEVTLKPLSKWAIWRGCQRLALLWGPRTRRIFTSVTHVNRKLTSQIAQVVHTHNTYTRLTADVVIISTHL